MAHARSLDDCPDDILMEIFNRVAMWSSHQPRNNNDICSLSLTSRRVHSLAARYLYRVIRLPIKPDYTGNPRPGFARTSASNASDFPPLCSALKHTRYLRIALQKPTRANEWTTLATWVATTLSHTTNLKTLAISFSPITVDPILTALATNHVSLHTVTTLHLTLPHGHGWGNPNTTFALLPHLPSLTTLTGFGRHHKSHDKFAHLLVAAAPHTRALAHLDLDWPWTLKLATALLAAWPRLASLALAAQDGTRARAIAFDALTHLLTRCPNVTHVSLPLLRGIPGAMRTRLDWRDDGAAAEKEEVRWENRARAVVGILEAVPSVRVVAVGCEGGYYVRMREGDVREPSFEMVRRKGWEGWRSYVEGVGEERVEWVGDGGVRRVERNPLFG